MGDLGPLRRAEVLAHVDDAVHGHIGVGLDQAGTNTDTHTHTKLHQPYTLRTQYEHILNTLYIAEYRAVKS